MSEGGEELWKREPQVKEPQSSVSHVHVWSSCTVGRSGQWLIHIAVKACKQPVSLLRREESPLAVTSPLGL